MNIFLVDLVVKDIFQVGFLTRIGLNFDPLPRPGSRAGSFALGFRGKPGKQEMVVLVVSRRRSPLDAGSEGGS